MTPINRGQRIVQELFVQPANACVVSPSGESLKEQAVFFGQLKYLLAKSADGRAFAILHRPLAVRNRTLLSLLVRLVCRPDASIVVKRLADVLKSRFLGDNSRYICPGKPPAPIIDLAHDRLHGRGRQIGTAVREFAPPPFLAPFASRLSHLAESC